jgi:signal transduction histidine kinase
VALEPQQALSDRTLGERRREDLLRKEHDALVDADTIDRIKQDFLTIVSHELRSPLAPMLLWVKALRRGDMSEALRARGFSMLESCINMQLKMIDDLIDVARGERGELRLERQRLDFRAVVQTTVEAMAPAVASKRISVTVEAEPEPLWVMGDAMRLGQVVSNLLSNAITFTPEAGRIAVSVRASEGEAALVLIDDGEGVDGARLDGTFERAGRVGELRAPGHQVGLGLGLTITRRLVEEHGGTITAASAGTGRGSCFTVTLPRDANGSSQ